MRGKIEGDGEVAMGAVTEKMGGGGWGKERKEGKRRGVKREEDKIQREKQWEKRKKENG